MLRNRTLVGMAFAFAAAVLWAVTLDSSLLLPAGFPTIELLAGRYGVQVILLLVLVLPFRGRSLVVTPHPKLQFLRGATMLIMPIAFTLAIRYISIPDAWAAEWAGPLLGAVIARYLLDDPVSNGVVGLVLVATLGAILARWPLAAPSLSGVAVVLVSAAAFGGFLALTRVLRTDRTSTGLFWTATCVLIPSLILMPMSWQVPSGRALVGLVLMGSLWLLVLLTIDEALRRAPLALLAPVFLTEIVWERLMFHESWGRGATLGAAAVLACAAACVVLVWRTNDERLPLVAGTVA